MKLRPWVRLCRAGLCSIPLWIAPAVLAAEPANNPPAAAAPKTYAFPEAPVGKTAGLEGAYLRVTSSFWNGRISLTHEGWFFTANGRFSRTPPGGFDALAFAKADVARRQDGVYWLEDGKLMLRWANGGKDTAYAFTRDESGWKIGGLAATPVPGFDRGWRIDALYEGGGTATGGGASVSSSKSLHLRSDGSFGASATGSASTESPAVSAGAASGSTAAGTYEFDGYTLLLRHADGREERRTVFGYGERDARGAPEFIWREGTMLRRRD